MKSLLLTLFIFLTIIILCSSVFAQNNSAPRFIKGAANITIINPSTTWLKICTPNEKYRMENGSKETIRLYVRNDMEDKTVNRVDLKIVSVDGFTFSFIPEYLENLEPDQYKYFDINVSVGSDVPFGNYRVDFLVGTDEYLVGAFTDEIMIRIRPYNNEMKYLFGAIIIIISIALIVRFVWIARVNKMAQQKHKKAKHSRKAVSQYYYKPKKMDKDKKSYKNNKKSYKNKKSYESKKKE